MPRPSCRRCAARGTAGAPSERSAPATAERSASISRFRSPATAAAATADAATAGSAIHAFMIALVDEGLLAWDTPVGEIWPDAHLTWRAVTLEQLLHHQSGATGNLPKDHPNIWMGMAAFGTGEPHEVRGHAVAALIGQPLDGEPGEFVYSNGGYVVVGAMLEARGGKPWETLIQERLFEPLGMTDCGFGPPVGKQPWGHTALAGTPMDPEQPRSDNPAALGPAGTVHCSLAAWGQFAAWHLRGARGEDQLLSQAAWTHLHSPPEGGSYADGWGVIATPEGTVLTHAGSNTMWYAEIVLAPKKDGAVLVVVNEGSKRAATASEAALRAIVELGVERP